MSTHPPFEAPRGTEAEAGGTARAGGAAHLDGTAEAGGTAYAGGMVERIASTAAQSAAHAAELSEFVMESPSSYHAAYAVRERLAAAGFTELSEEEVWDLSPGGRYVVVRDGAVIAFALPDADGAATDTATGSTPLPPFRVLGAHTDSPAFKLGPNPDFTAEGALQSGVEVYGGPLLNSWLDRELCFAGRLVLRDGTTVLARTGPIARIPQLAIHLDRKANDGLALDRQRHTQPVIGLADMVNEAAAESLVLSLLAESAEVAPGEVAGVDAVTFPVQAPALFGAHSEFLASPRLDNLSSVWAGTSAIEAVDPEALDAIAVLAAFDHEEVGSETRSGASGPFLADVLERIGLGLRAGREEYLRALAGSVCLSSDAGHAVHPNYPGHHDPVNRPRLGRGPLLKINAQQRYSTDAVGTAVWARACARAGIAHQEFVSNNTVPCGSTIGPLTATRLGMTTVDVGLALWSMHSAREMCAIEDLTALRDAVDAFFHG